MSENVKYTAVEIDKRNRSLVASCMGNISMAADWLKQAAAFIQQGGTLNAFVSSAHPSNRRKAKAAYLLAECDVKFACQL